MTNPARTPCGAIFQNEVLLNSKRVAPYAMMILFGANAWLWTVKGPAASHGWTTNGDFFIVRIFAVVSFMTLPLFTALIMGDPVVRDFRAGVAPLVFSKPVGRAGYLLGKFSGNFFVLICCQTAFPLTLFVLQGFHVPGTPVQPARLSPYFKHFLLTVVVTHLVLAAVYFTVGTLTRNVKIVYGLAVSFYPLTIVYMTFLKTLPGRWRIALDPFLINWPDLSAKARDGAWLDAATINQLTFEYHADLILNRAAMLLVAVLCLTILYFRFSIVERFKRDAEQNALTTINLGATERLVGGGRNYDSARAARLQEDAHGREAFTRGNSVTIPQVYAATGGFRASFKQWRAALTVEFRLLYAERGVVVLVPLATLLCVVGLGYYDAVPDGSYSAVYAASVAESLLLFLSAIAVFYTGEAMHRDRELRVEPTLWSAPVPNFALLLSKASATLLLSIALCAAVGLTAVALQIYKGHTPVEVSTYLAVYTVVLLPGIVFLIAAATILNVLLRDKYLAYAVSFACGIGLFYLFNQGYNHWLYNPFLYGLWTPADLNVAAEGLPQIITHRIYTLALATFLLALAHLRFERKATRGRRPRARLSDARWPVLSMLLSGAMAVVTGWKLYDGL